MTAITKERLFGWHNAFDDPVTTVIVTLVASGLVFASLIVFVMARTGKLSDERRAELRARLISWSILAPAMIMPVLLGAAWHFVAVTVLSLLCYREFARATGLFRERAVSATVVVGILAINFAALDHWYHFFVALLPLTVAVIAAVAIFADRPQGYTQRVSLGVIAFLFFGACLGCLSYLGNHTNYRPIVLSLLLAVELNDIFAYICGKSFGRRKLAPNTSPNKTIGGSVGAFILTTILMAVMGHYVFLDTALDTPIKLIGLGVIVSFSGQMGDLMMSSFKRDLGIKDMDVIIPGHGGFLDRFDSLLLVAPAVFHYVGYILGIGLDQPARIFTGG